MEFMNTNWFRLVMFIVVICLFIWIAIVTGLLDKVMKVGKGAVTPPAVV